MIRPCFDTSGGLTMVLYFYSSSRTRGQALAKSILVSEDTHRRLMAAKMEIGFKSMDDMLGRLVTEVDKARFHEASERFRGALKQKHLSPAKVAALRVTCSSSPTLVSATPNLNTASSS